MKPHAKRSEYKFAASYLFLISNFREFLHFKTGIFNKSTALQKPSADGVKSIASNNNSNYLNNNNDSISFPVNYVDSLSVILFQCCTLVNVFSPGFDIFALRYLFTVFMPRPSKEWYQIIAYPINTQDRSCIRDESSWHTHGYHQECCIITRTRNLYNKFKNGSLQRSLL